MVKQPDIEVDIGRANFGMKNTDKFPIIAKRLLAKIGHKNVKTITVTKKTKISKEQIEEGDDDSGYYAYGTIGIDFFDATNKKVREEIDFSFYYDSYTKARKMADSYFSTIKTGQVYDLVNAKVVTKTAQNKLMEFYIHTDSTGILKHVNIKAKTLTDAVAEFESKYDNWSKITQIRNYTTDEVFLPKKSKVIDVANNRKQKDVQDAKKNRAAFLKQTSKILQEAENIIDKNRNSSDPIIDKIDAIYGDLWTASDNEEVAKTNALAKKLRTTLDAYYKKKQQR